MLAREQKHSKPPRPRSLNHIRRKDPADQQQQPDLVSCDPTQVPLPGTSPTPTLDSSSRTCEPPDEEILFLNSDVQQRQLCCPQGERLAEVFRQTERMLKFRISELEAAVDQRQHLVEENDRLRAQVSNRATAQTSTSPDGPLAQGEDGSPALAQLVSNHTQSPSTQSDASASSPSTPAARGQHKADWSMSSSTSHPDVTRISPSLASGHRGLSASDPLSIQISLNSDLQERLEQVVADELAARRRFSKALKRIDTLQRRLDDAQTRLEEEEDESPGSKWSTTSSATLAEISRAASRARCDSADVSEQRTEEWPVTTGTSAADVSQARLLASREPLSLRPSQHPTQDRSPPTVGRFGEDQLNIEEESLTRFVGDDEGLPFELLHDTLASDLDLNEKVKTLEMFVEQLLDSNQHLEGRLEVLQEAYISVEQLIQPPADWQSSNTDDFEMEEGLCGQGSGGTKASSFGGGRHQYSPKRPSRLSKASNFLSSSDERDDDFTGTRSGDADAGAGLGLLTQTSTEEEDHFDFTRSLGVPFLGHSIDPDEQLELERASKRQRVSRHASGPCGSSDKVRGADEVDEQEVQPLDIDALFSGVPVKTRPLKQVRPQMPEPIRQQQQPPLESIEEYDIIPLERKDNGDWVLRKDQTSTRPVHGWCMLLNGNGGRLSKTPTEEFEKRLSDFAAGFEHRSVKKDIALNDEDKDCQGRPTLDVAVQSRLRLPHLRGSQWLVSIWLWVQFGWLLFMALAMSLWQGPSLLHSNRRAGRFVHNASEKSCKT